MSNSIPSLIPALAVLCASCAFSQQAETESDSLTKIQNAFHEHLRSLYIPSAKLNRQYHTALLRLQKDIQKTGNFDAAVAVQDELERYRETVLPPAEVSSVGDLRRLQDAYIRKHETVISDLCDQIQRAKDNYKSALQKLSRESAASNRPEQADQLLAAFHDVDSPSGGGPIGFHEKMDVKNFFVEVAQFRLRQKLGIVRSENKSPYGHLVLAVEPDSTAGDLQIQPNDRIVRVGQVDLWHQHVKLPRTNEPRTLIWERAIDNSLQSEKMTRPGIGVRFIGDPEPYRYFLSQGVRHPSWDDFVLIAFMAAPYRPELAETAMHHAMSLGYKADSISSSIGIMVCLRNNRPAKSLEYARHILRCADNNAGDIPLPVLPIYLRALLASGQLDMLRSADVEHGTAFTRLSEIAWDDFLKAWKSTRQDWDAADRPSTKVESMKLNEVFSKRELKMDFISTAVSEIPRKQDGPDKFIVLPNSFTTSFFTIRGGIENCVFEVEFEADITTPSNEEHRFEPTIRFAMLNYQEGGKQPLVKASYYKREGGKYRFDVSGGLQSKFRPSFTSACLDSDNPEPTKVKLIRLGNEVEVQLNGATQAWLHLPPGHGVHNVGFMISIVGKTVVFHKTEIWEIESS